MFRLPTLVSLLALALTMTAASPCVTFDSNFNLLVLGLGGKDWNAGTQDAWTSGTASDITTSGRPPFNGANTTCYLSQFNNAVYVMNGDSSSPSAVHIYDAAAKSWSTQSVTTGTFDPSSFNTILDHDTNVFYALSHGEMFFLNMEQMKAATSSPLSWTDVEKAPYDASYQPVMALAQNHIHFLDVPGTPAGDAQIFVIHFSFFQPEPQAYPLPDGSAFPATHGQTASFFQPSDVQQEFAFIPDDGSNTFVINVETNTTQSLPGPSSKDPKAIYAASITSLVQLDSNGAVSFLPYKEGDAATNSKASWTPVANVAAAVPAGSTSSSSSAGTSGTASGSQSSSTATGKSSSGSPTPTGSSGSQTTNAGISLSGTSFGSMMVLGGIFSIFACLL